MRAAVVCHVQAECEERDRERAVRLPMRVCVSMR